MSINVSSRYFSAYFPSSYSFVVPSHQRDFSWGKGEARDLFFDILEVATGGRSDHFLGSMVFIQQNSTDPLTILDGQQRIATIITLYCAIRDTLQNFAPTAPSSSEVVANINYAICERSGYTSINSRVPRAKLNSRDDAFFKSLVEGNIQTTRYKSNRLIKECYDVFIDEIVTLANSSLFKGDFVSTATTILDTIDKKMPFIEIILDTTSNAYIVFQSLNGRGLELSISDLFKNLLFIAANGTSIDISQFWIDLTDTLKDNNLTKFLRYYYNSRIGFSRKSDLLDDLKNYLKNQNLKKFLQELKRSAEAYVKLVNPQTKGWGMYPQIYDSLIALKTLGFEQAYVLILSAYEHVYPTDPKSFFALLEAIENFSFRYGTINGLNHNKLETDYSRYAIDLRNGKTQVSEIINSLRSLNPSSTVFESAFMSYEPKSASVARYMLMKIENYLCQANGSAKSVDVKKVDLEHIIPQKISPLWGTYLNTHNTDPNEVISKLGNLTLLHKSTNKSIGNQPFDQKLKHYIASNNDIEITKWLSKYSDFAKNEVEDRQRMLALYADLVWKV